MNPMTRRLDLDWLRIVAFGLLILYHTGMYYVTWDFHVKSPFASDALEPFMLLTSPWRLSLLFLVSGAATAFLYGRGAPRFLRARSWRLLVPLAFGMLVVVPPQSYYEVVEKLGYQGSYWEFWGRYLRADDRFCKADDCLDLPTWNHLWFVAYLWVYTMILGGLLRFAPKALDALGTLVARAPFLPLLVWLAAVRVLMLTPFPSTHGLFDDLYNHAQYFPVFLFAFVIARRDDVWARVHAWRWRAVLGWALSYAFLVWYFTTQGDDVDRTLLSVQRVIFAFNGWCAIWAALGLARARSLEDGPLRRYLTEAIFPFYIVHQTAIIVLAMWLRALGLRPWAEMPILVGLTAIVCVAVFEVVRRVGWLRPLMGLRTAREKML
jgi:glucans biosynthesis protein C